MENKETQADDQLVTTVYRKIGEETWRIATEKDMKLNEFLVTRPGLTKREYFASLAMQGMLSACRGYNSQASDHLAKCAVVQADELIKQLNKAQP